MLSADIFRQSTLSAISALITALLIEFKVTSNLDFSKGSTRSTAFR